MGTYMMGRTDRYKLPYDFHTHIMECIHTDNE